MRSVLRSFRHHDRDSPMPRPDEIVLCMAVADGGGQTQAGQRANYGLRELRWFAVHIPDTVYKCLQDRGPAC